MKKYAKFLAVLIAMVMALSVFGAPLMASAAEGDAPVIEEEETTFLQKFLALLEMILFWIYDGSIFFFFGNTNYT